jgi:hypothetical protein
MPVLIPLVAVAWVFIVLFVVALCRAAGGPRQRSGSQ